MNSVQLQRLIDQAIRSLEAAEPGFTRDSACRIGVFHTNALGVCDRVHPWFLDITDPVTRRVINKIWLHTVACSDRDRVCREWHQSIMKNRLFTSSFRIPDRARGDLKQVSCAMIPELSESRRTIGYLGIFVEAKEYRQAV